MWKKINFWLLCILSLGAVLRLVNLANFPAGFTADEAAFGYNAYSIVKTGKDEWGIPWQKLFTTNLRSFGDYKLPLYSFLAIPFIQTLGLTETAVRLPNAILGTLAIVAIYLLAKQLFGKQRIALLAAFILCLSPWHIQLSRGAFEANLITFFAPMGIYWLLTKRYIWAAFIFGLSFYSYHTARYLTPIFILLTLFYSRSSRTQTIKFLAVLLLICSLGLLSLVGKGGTRVADVGIFNPTDNWSGVSDRRFVARNRGLPDTVARVFSNKATYFVALLGRNYLNYFSTQFFFTSGPSESTYGMLTGRGVLYWLELIPLLAFIVRFVKKPDRISLFVILLLLIAPLPAAAAKGSGSAANRTASMIPFLSLTLAVGLDYLLVHSQKILPLFLVLYLGSFLFFAEDYIFHSPLVTGPSMSYGWRDLSVRLKNIAKEFTDVRFSRTLSEPHIFVAFYWRTDPSQYQNDLMRYDDFQTQGYKFLDQLSGYQVDGYWFGDIHPTDPIDHKVLYIGPPDQFPPDFSEYFHVDMPNGKTAIKVAQNNIQ